MNESILASAIRNITKTEGGTNGSVFFAWYTWFGASIFSAKAAPPADQWYGPIRIAAGAFRLIESKLSQDGSRVAHVDHGYMKPDRIIETLEKQFKLLHDPKIYTDDIEMAFKIKTPKTFQSAPAWTRENTD